MVESTPVQDPQEKKDEAKDAKVEEKKVKKTEEELSAEDLKMKEEYDSWVEQLKDDKAAHTEVLNTLRKEISEATSSMTSVPKPLKFLRAHYDTLKDLVEKFTAGSDKDLLCEITSVVGMTSAASGTRECLAYCLRGSKNDLGQWGHEYVRHLAGEIGEEYQSLSDKEGDKESALMSLVAQIVPLHIHQNAEAEACDLLLEVEKLPDVLNHVDQDNHEKVSRYLEQCAQFIPSPDDRAILQVIMDIYKKLEKHSEALRIALKVDDKEAVKDVFNSISDPSTKKQLALILGRHRAFYVETDDEATGDLISNSHLPEHFKKLGEDLEVSEPKIPEDIYKSHLQSGRATNIDSARQNLASTFVNAFVNCGFGDDKLMLTEGTKWLYKNKEHGMMSAAASIGMLLLWDVDSGLTHIDKFLYTTDDHIKAGALLAVGVVNSGVRSECDPALALLSEYLENKSNILRVGAINGLALAYAGTEKEEVLPLMLPLLSDSTLPMEVVAVAALALGNVYCGTCNNDAAEGIMSVLLERDETSLNDPYAKYLCLGLGLLFLGAREDAEATLEALKVTPHPIGKFAALIVEVCAFAGSGNVLKIQEMLHICAEHLEENNSHQSIAVLGIALIAIGEDLGSQMALRTFDHLLQYGDLVIRKAVPLALGLLKVSDPSVNVMETLSKLTHDADPDVSMAAIFSLGLTGAGTNHARQAGILRQLSQYYQKEPNHLFVVRIAQGLLHMGKGLQTLSPFSADKSVLGKTAICGLLGAVFTCLDFKAFLLGKGHHFLYHLTSAISPRMMIALDEDLKPLQTTVRVGQALDTVGQAGKPKTITGFQTHTTPVLIGAGERVELGSDEFIPLTSVLEGFVILKKNPDFKEEVPETKK